MGRKKSYERNELIEKAMEIFRDHGFAGTSAEMLSKELGVNRFGLYSEFGNKQGLFDAALKRYDELVVERNFGPLESADSGINEIRDLLKFYGEAGKGQAAGRGCLLCNTAVEFGPDDPSGAGYIEQYFNRLSNAFFTALSNAEINGQLKISVDTRMEADFFTSSVLGMFVMLRAKASPSTVKRTADAAITHLDSLLV